MKSKIRTFFDKFDQNKVRISEVQSYSTLLGKVLGFISIVLLGFTLIYKLSNMLTKQTMHLNSFYANDRSAINMNNSQIKLQLYVADGIPLRYNQQYKYGLNLTITKYIFYNDKKEHENASFVWGNQYFNFNSKYYVNANANVHAHAHAKTGLFQQSVKFDYATYPMVPCQQDVDAFCVPSQLLEDMIVIGDRRFKDKLIINYLIKAETCDKLHPQCKSPSSLFGYLTILSFKCQNFDVYKKQTQQIVSQCNYPTSALFIIADPSNTTQSMTFKFNKVSINTTQPTLIPSFIPKSFVPSSLSNSNYMQFWYRDDQIQSSSHKRYTDRDPYLFIGFERSIKSQSYQRSFTNIDNVLAELVGLSSLVAFVLGCCVGSYAKWESRCYVHARVEKDQELRGSFWGYVTQKIVCCSKLKQADRKQKRQQVLKQVYQVADIIKLSATIKNLKQRIQKLQAHTKYPIAVEQEQEEQISQYQKEQEEGIQKSMMKKQVKKCELNESIEQKLINNDSEQII